MGVTLLCFGKRGYALAASNMVLSLRYHGYTGPIHLHVGSGLLPAIDKATAEQCKIVPLKDEYAEDAGWCKVNLPQIFQGEETLYLDVDGIALANVQTLIDELKKDPRHYITTVVGKGKDGEKIAYYEWAKTGVVKAKHDLPEDAVYYGIQSSWAYFKKGKALDELSQKVKEAWKQWNRKELRSQWGRSMPDELFYSIACTQLKYDPSWNTAPVHFGRGFDKLPELRKKHYVLSLFGSGRGTGSVPPRFVACYDAEIRTIRKDNPSQYSARWIRRDKYVDTR
jgi:hypothetical protein